MGVAASAIPNLNWGSASQIPPPGQAAASAEPLGKKHGPTSSAPTHPPAPGTCMLYHKPWSRREALGSQGPGKGGGVCTFPIALVRSSAHFSCSVSVAGTTLDLFPRLQAGGWAPWPSVGAAHSNAGKGLGGRICQIFERGPQEGSSHCCPLTCGGGRDPSSSSCKGGRSRLPLLSTPNAGFLAALPALQAGEQRHTGHLERCRPPVWSEVWRGVMG